ncbi:hypothetical protein AVEN_17337-1 [Araneus ventricosus]|uniref:Uncharacterized protein n=1 Tax=Araneus ventricosus TaxID=182803 RepID=A0A4Y2UQ61_ARAVE|nr:hypothetical protein AVEN_17337-1 [Araneus ventricosus]
MPSLIAIIGHGTVPSEGGTYHRWWPEVAGRSFRCEEKKITQAASISLENGMVTHLDKSPDAGTTIPSFLFQRNRHVRRAFPKSASLATY